MGTKKREQRSSAAAAGVDPLNAATANAFVFIGVEVRAKLVELSAPDRAPEFDEDVPCDRGTAVDQLDPLTAAPLQRRTSPPLLRCRSDDQDSGSD